MRVRVRLEGDELIHGAAEQSFDSVVQIHVEIAKGVFVIEQHALNALRIRTMTHQPGSLAILPEAADTFVLAMY